MWAMQSLRRGATGLAGVGMKSGAAARAASSSATAVGGLPRALYNNVWRKSNILYITYIVAGCVVIEVVYGSATNAIWEGRNKGVRFSHQCCSLCRLPIHSLMHPPIHRPTLHPQKLYKHIDWSKFKGEDDEEDEE